MTRTAFDPDELAILEEERDFLLRSLDDLDAEREAGNLDGAEYERLRDDYTARAAAVIRSIRDGIDSRPQAPPVPGRRKVTVAVAVGGFALVAALLLGRALGERLPGETVTGNDQTRQAADAGGAGAADGGGATDGTDVAGSAVDRKEAIEAFRAAVERDPGDVEARLRYAGVLLQAGEAADALREYDEAARLAPGDARPRAASAMVVFQAGLVDEALARLDEAARVEPDFPDTWFVRGLVLARGRSDREGAAEAFRRYLELAPDGAYAEDAETLVEELSR